MNRLPVDPNLSEIESFLAVERELIPEPDDIRHRGIERARASMPRNLSGTLPVRSASPRRVRIAALAAGAVILSALCAVAFLAGYRIRNRSTEVPTAMPPLTPSVDVQRMPSPSVVVALIPVAPAVSQLSTNSEASLGGPRRGRVSPAGAAKSVIDVESYSKELGVLQPARQAVARQDFGAALAAIVEHQRLFPSGRLAEEREALRVKALLGLGRTDEAQRAGSAFRARFPRSALLERINEMLEPQK